MWRRIACIAVGVGVLALLLDLLEWILEQIDPDGDYLPDGKTLRPDVPRYR